MKRYKHNLSHYRLLTGDMGEILPVGLVECLPGDTFQHHTNVLIRLSPLAAPIMHHITARVHHFFVPHRLVWNTELGDPGNFEDFITGGKDGDDAQQVPTITLDGSQWEWKTNPGAQAWKLPEYLGIPEPKEGNNEITVNALPFRAYNLIFREYYEDQDLGLNPDITQSLYIRRCCWERDYFSTARPWTQKGPDVTLPIASRAPIYSTDIVANGGKSGPAVDTVNAPSVPGLWPSDDADGDRIYADLSQAEPVSVNDFRKAFALQRYQEARARFGSKYVDYLRFLGVRPRDERLQRPEFLGGGNAQIQISEILQTAPETGAEPSTEYGVGDMYGHGIAAMRSNKYRRTFEEHGYVLTMLSVRPKTIYPTAIDRHFLYQDKEDFFQKELQHIGQQEIDNREIYGTGGDDAAGVFGYQDRYAQYRGCFSKVVGEYRDILNYWHMGREFDQQPTLNNQFVTCNPTKRIHNEQTQNAMWIACQHRLGARRMVDRSAKARIY